MIQGKGGGRLLEDGGLWFAFRVFWGDGGLVEEDGVSVCVGLLCLDGALANGVGDLAELALDHELAYDVGMELERTVWLCDGGETKVYLVC